MDVVKRFTEAFESFGTYDTVTGKYKDGSAFSFDYRCQNSRKYVKVDYNEVLADLMIFDTEPHGFRWLTNIRVEAIIMRDHPSKDAFDPSADRNTKIAWIKKHLSLTEKITVLAEALAFEGEEYYYLPEISETKEHSLYVKKCCVTEGKQLIDKYRSFLTELNNTIQSLRNNNKGSNIELKELVALYDKARRQQAVFERAINRSLYDNEIIEEDETDNDSKAGGRANISSSDESEYASLTDRGKQAYDSQMAHNLYQSFARADRYKKFLLLTRLEVRNMLEIARNLSHVSERKDLQSYCEDLIDSGFITLSSGCLEAFSVNIGKETFHFEAISASELKDGLRDTRIEKDIHLIQIFIFDKGKFFRCISLEDFAKIQNYSNAILLSSVLQEARWGIGRQIKQGWLHRRDSHRSNSNDLARNVVSLMEYYYERRDKIFKKICKTVGGIDLSVFEEYGPNTVLTLNDF